jgi:hypothetical protein
MAVAAEGDPQAQLIYPRAVEATIWGMPAVSMAAIRRSLARDLDAEFGDIVYFSNVMAPRHEFLTANNQTPYVLTVFDLRRGPMVLDVPPASSKVALFGSGIDSFEVPLVDVGPTGEDAGRGGRYVFLPPGYDAAEPDGFIVVPSQTYFVHFALRPITLGEGTLDDAVAYSQQLKSYALADASAPPMNTYVDAFPRAWRTLPTFDLDFLRLLAEVIEIEPAQEKDAVMLAMLASIGIEKGKPFAPDAERAELLTGAVRDGATTMNDYFVHHSFAPHWPNRQWQATQPGKYHGFTFFGDGRLEYDHRAGAFAFWATWAPKRPPGDAKKLPASYYLKGFADATGERFHGDRTYRLRIPADTPAKDFWSIIAYEVGTNAFIHNPQDKVGVSSYDKDTLIVNDDGSIDVVIGPNAPDGMESNWIPTHGRDFWLVARFYGPQLPLFDKTWTLNDVEKMS